MPWRNPHRALFLAMVANMALVATAGVLTVGASRSNCRDRVAVRDDNRAMWVWLTDQFPGEALADAAVVELNTRLPELRCGGLLGTHPVPKQPEVIIS